MCTLISKISPSKFIGYKVAIKINDKYYSPAMGFMYEVGKVPIIIEQKRLSHFFKENILEGSCSYKYNMVGRTSILINKKDAIRLLEDIESKINLSKPYSVVILKMEISDSLMCGNYEGCDVVAGRKIESFKECYIIQE